MPTQSWSWVNGTCFLVFAIPHSSIPPYEDVPGYTGSWHAWTPKSQYCQPIPGQIHMSISTCVWWNMQTKSDIQVLLWNNPHILSEYDPVYWTLHFSNASLKLLHMPHNSTLPPASAPPHMLPLLVCLFVFFPFQIVSVNWWAVDWHQVQLHP